MKALTTQEGKTLSKLVGLLSYSEMTYLSRSSSFDEPYDLLLSLMLGL